MEVEKSFSDYYFNVKEDDDPVELWKGMRKYPQVALAIDYLVTPCSSSAVESLFSHAGFLSSGLRNRVAPDNLESHIVRVMAKGRILF